MSDWQVLEFSGNGIFDHEADIRRAVLFLVLSRLEEGIASSIFRREGALVGKAYFAGSSNIDVQPK